MTEKTGVWLHAVTRGLERRIEVTGIADAPVRTVSTAGLVAVASPVDLDEYGEEPLRRNLEDLGWLERTALEHHRAIEAVAALVPAVPARLATVYHDEVRLAEALAQQRIEIAAALDRLAGRAEWGVKAYVVSPAADDAGHHDDAAAGGPGTAYLRRRKAQLSTAQQRQQSAVDAAEQVHAVLAEWAEVARRHPPQDQRLSGVPEWMVLNGAYLVDVGRAAEFAGLVRALDARHSGLRLELTGPWPPYSFAAADAEEPRR